MYLIVIVIGLATRIISGVIRYVPFTARRCVLWNMEDFDDEEDSFGPRTILIRSQAGYNAARDEGHQNSVHKVALTSSWNVMALVRLSSYNQVLTRDTIEEHLYIPVNILHRPRALAFLPTPCYGDSPLHALRMQSGKHWRPRHRGSSPNTSVPPSIDSQPLDLSPSPHHR